VYARKPELDAAGVALCCTVKEDLPAAKEGEDGEVEAFRKGFWPEAPIYLDATLAFYSAIGGGSTKKTSVAAFLAKLANPFSAFNKNAKRSKGTDGNLTGEGLVHGGVYVVKAGALKDEPPVFAHQELEIGDHPPTDDLVAACLKAADLSSKAGAS